MLVSAHPGGHLTVCQPAHAWLSGQLARAWGNERFGQVQPHEEVCLAAEQHDIGMAAWDRAPTLDPGTGLPTSFTAMDVDTHTRLWTEGPELLLSQSRYAALLVSLHGSALYAGRDMSSRGEAERKRVEAFRARRLVFERRLRSDLGAGDAQLARNQRLLRTWDGLSLALILGWAPWNAEDVPAAAGEPLTLSLMAGDGHHLLRPWPFRESRLVVGCEGRLLERRYTHEHELRVALEQAPWLDLVFELRPG